MASETLALNGRPMVSFIIPLLNEEQTIVELSNQLNRQMELLGIPNFEIVFINDGSTDGSAQVLDGLHKKDSKVSVIHFRRNFGKAAAIDAGFQYSTGEIVFTMDADLQDDPEEIGNFLRRIEDGFDLVNGWKRVRHDPITKTAPSKLFNFTLSTVSGLSLHDFNCGFKAYRREAAEAIDVYGDLHRYIPILVHWKGFKVTEIEVRHHPRRFGKSKYGIERILRGLFDCLTIVLLTRYESRPLHLFGNVGALLGAVGFGVLAYLSVLWLMGQSIGNRPLLILGALLLLVGVQLVSAGLVAEMLTRQNNQLRKNYLVREVRRAGHEFKPSRSVFSGDRVVPAGTEPVVERSAEGALGPAQGAVPVRAEAVTE